MGECPYHLLGNHHGARQPCSRPCHFLREKPWDVWWKWRGSTWLSSSPFGRVARSHARAARERRRECVLSRPSCLINGELASRLRLSSTRPFRDRADFASKNDSAVLLVNFLCGNLDHEYSFSINYYTLKTPKILEGLAPFIGSEISFRDFPSTAKKSVFGRRGGDGAMTKLKQL